MAHSKSEIPRFATSRDDVTDPVIMEGMYWIVDVTCGTSNGDEIAIGDVCYFTANSVSEITVGEDNSRPVGIVPDSVKNIAAIESNNAGSDWTKELLFAAGDTIEFAILAPGTIISAKIEANTALEIGDGMVAGATGALTVGDDTSYNVAMSLVYTTSGDNTDGVAAMWGNTSLSTNVNS